MVLQESFCTFKMGVFKMRELLSQYGNLLLALLGGGAGIGFAFLVLNLIQPLASDVLTNLM